MIVELTDRIYEAAFVPELWPGVLDQASTVSNSAAASLVLFSGRAPPKFIATDLITPVLQAFDAANGCQKSEEVRLLFSMTPPRHSSTTSITFPPKRLKATICVSTEPGRWGSAGRSALSSSCRQARWRCFGVVAAVSVQKTGRLSFGAEHLKLAQRSRSSRYRLMFGLGWNRPLRRIRLLLEVAGYRAISLPFLLLDWPRVSCPRDGG
jgi:hypothetical protein